MKRLSILLALVACGDDAPTTPNADAAVDVAVDALPFGCSYAEQRDLTNDDVAPATGTPEATGLTFASQTVLCGSFAHDHFDGDITVDIDGYVLSLANPADVLVRISGAGAQNIEFVGVDIYGGASFTQLVGTNTFYGNHGVTSVHLTAGTYELAAFALHQTAITAPVPYRIEVIADTPASRCAEVTSGGYLETTDGTNNDGNDVIRLMSGSPPALTASATDAPEATGLVIGTTTNERISGSAADIAIPDLYEDKDTFAFTTGNMTNELVVRLTWPGTTADLDYLLFEANDPLPVFRTNTSALQAPEMQTYSIKPSTSYWLLVGAKAASTGLPIAYNATLCGSAWLMP